MMCGWWLQVARPAIKFVAREAAPLDRGILLLLRFDARLIPDNAPKPGGDFRMFWHECMRDVKYAGGLSYRISLTALPPNVAIHLSVLMRARTAPRHNSGP